MKWWKPLLILLLCATPSWAGFWSDFPGVGPGTVLNDIIIDNSTINSSTLSQPIIDNPTFNGTSTYNPGTIVNYDPSTVIEGPNGSYWTNEGITNLASLTIAVGGTLTVPPGSFLYLPDGSVWDSKGLSTLNIQAGGVITVGGIPAGGACPANQFYIALSSALVPTCAPITNIPGPVTIHNPTFTGTVTGPDGGTWTSTGISLPTTSNITVGTVNITGTGGLTFNTVPVGGTCPANEYVYGISPTLVPVCSTPTGGGGGGTIATPVSVANGGLGQGNSPSVGQILVANGPNQYNPVTMSGDATINSAGQITLTKAYQPLTSTSVTAPTNPVVGQLYFDPTKLQTYIWYNDGTSSQWVAVVNLSAATLNNPTLNNATFTGTVTFPNGAIADAALARPYSGVGACSAGQFVNALTRNAPPTCAAVNALASGTTINNPTFTGTLQYPDGSYYDANGHEVMKNLGVGVVAYTDGANAGSGTVSGNSIVVKGSGWDNTNAPNGYWDDGGLEQMYGLDSKWLDLGNPSAQVDGWGTIHGDANNAALSNPWAELDLTNQSAYAGGAIDTGYDQRWQAEGFQNLNAIGIHQQTWQQGCTGVTVTAGITGAGAYLSDCAVAATASSFNNNLNYKILLTNNATTAAGEASVLLGNSTHTGGMYLTGTGWTPTPTYNSDQLVFDTTAANGIAFNNKVIFHNLATSAIYFGSLARPSGSFLSWGGGGNDDLRMCAGTHYDGNNWIADATTAQCLSGQGTGIHFQNATGLTVGAQAPLPDVASMDASGVNIPTGEHYQIGGVPLTTNQIAFSMTMVGQAGGTCTATTNNAFASRVWNHVTVQVQYQANCPAGMGGWLQLGGFPWANTNNTYSYCVIETGNFTYDTNYWPADCRMLPGWAGCIPVEIGSGLSAQYYNSAFLSSKSVVLNMTCNYLTDSMSP